MVALIPYVRDDYKLTLIYVAIIAIALFIKRKHMDVQVLIFGFIVMIVSEYFFINTGVETFNRHTLLGIMPLWLPFLWAYGFVAIKRALDILGA